MIRKTLGIGLFLFAAQAAVADTAESALSTVNSFEKLFGVTEGKRRNHTKGFCFHATLIPGDAAIQKLSSSALFTSESKVIGRLSHKGGNNTAPDHKHADYGMGLSISTTAGETHLMSMNTLDFFPVATPEAFAALTLAQTKGKEAVKAFKANSPDLQRYKAHAGNKDKTLRPYEGTRYNSVNSFYLVNDAGDKTAIRWSFVPATAQEVVLEPKQDFFFDNMKMNLETNDIVWNMIVTIANEDDAVDNAAIPWEGEHKEILAATLKVSAVNSEQEGKCDGINYDPMVLSSGFEPSADPLLQARRSSYAISFGRRICEK